MHNIRFLTWLCLLSSGMWLALFYLVIKNATYICMLGYVYAAAHASRAMVQQTSIIICRVKWFLTFRFIKFHKFSKPILTALLCSRNLKMLDLLSTLWPPIANRGCLPEALNLPVCFFLTRGKRQTHPQLSPSWLVLSQASLDSVCTIAYGWNIFRRCYGITCGWVRA